MLDELSPDAKIPLSSRFVAAKATSAPRSCPRCATTMAQVSMYGVPLDHCAEHGVWFDVNELANVLNENGQAYADRTAPKNTNRAFAIADILLGRPLTALADWLWWSRRTPKTPADASLPEKS
jgi:Zn-finger nucleic acid-binding protein